MISRGLVLAVTLALSATAAKAHEFWLTPEDYTIAPSDTLRVGLRIGSEMKGSSLIYDGLAVVVHETMDSTLTYTDFGVFQRFVAHKDFATALADHATRGLPEKNFRETYRRHAKSLVAIGAGAGSDRAVGLPIEIVALANPYTDDLGAGLPVLVLLDGAPRPDTQVELFQTAPDGTVTITLHRTDAEGRALLPMQPGMEYLVDNVVLRALPNDDPVAGPVWHSDWASLTFRTPD